MVKCKMDIGNSYCQSFAYWKLNKSILACGAYRNQMKTLVKRVFFSNVLSNHWWHVHIRAIRLESIRFTKQLRLEKARVKGRLINELEEASRLGFAYQTLAAREALDRQLKSKHEGCPSVECLPFDASLHPRNSHLHFTILHKL